MPEAWILKLKAAYDAGYYRTEVDEAGQTTFPWQGRTCLDCPFWLNGVCRVYAVARDGKAHTCKTKKIGSGDRKGVKWRSISRRKGHIHGRPAATACLAG